MNSKKLTDSKYMILLCCAFMLIIVAIMVGISGAKYADSFTGYSSFGAASFNSVILGDCSETLKAFDGIICTDDCMPGMTYSEQDEKNTAKKIPFSVANGTDDETASGVSVEYTIKLRATRNIPLKFSLGYITSEESETEGGEPVVSKQVYSADEPVLVNENRSNSNNVWYEWTFLDETVEGESATEAFFSLDGGAMNLNRHEIIVEWPINNTIYDEGIPDNSTKYMKELDLLEVLVTVSSKNSLKEEKEEITYAANDLYGKGIIIIDPSIAPNGSDEEYPYHYTYPISLKAFYDVEGSDTQKAYDFSVNNGAGIGINQTALYTDYMLELKVPYTALDPAKNALPTNEFEYFLSVFNKTTEEYSELMPIRYEYRLYNVEYGEDYGTYTIVSPDSDTFDEDVEKWTAEKSEVRLFKVYQYTQIDQYGSNMPFRLTNRIPDNMGEYKDNTDNISYRIVLENANLNPITVFENKVEIIIKATQTNGNR